MKLDWSFVVVVALLVGGGVGCLAFEQIEAGWFLLGTGTGLLPARGAIKPRPKSGPPTAVAALLALLLLSGCTPAVLVADTTLTEVCDAAGDEIDAEHERGELTTDQAECAVLGLRRACLEIHDRLAESIDEEE